MWGKIMKKSMINFKSGYCFTLLTCLLCGCATSYGPATEQNGFGYMDRKIEPDHYNIQVKGSPYTDKETVKSHFMKRAEELCGSNAFNVVRMDQEEAHSTVRGIFGAHHSDYPFLDGEIRCKKAN